MTDRDRLFGDTAVALGLLSRAQLDQCAHILEKSDRRRTISAICLQEGFMAIDDVHRVLNEQSDRVRHSPLPPPPQKDGPPAAQAAAVVARETSTAIDALSGTNPPAVSGSTPPPQVNLPPAAPPPMPSSPPAVPPIVQGTLQSSPSLPAISSPPGDGMFPDAVPVNPALRVHPSSPAPYTGSPTPPAGSPLPSHDQSGHFTLAQAQLAQAAAAASAASGQRPSFPPPPAPIAPPPGYGAYPPQTSPYGAPPQRPPAYPTPLPFPSPYPGYNPYAAMPGYRPEMTIPPGFNLGYPKPVPPPGTPGYLNSGAPPPPPSYPSLPAVQGMTIPPGMVAQQAPAVVREPSAPPAVPTPTPPPPAPAIPSAPSGPAPAWPASQVDNAVARMLALKDTPNAGADSVIGKLLGRAIELGASDLHIHSGSQVLVRKDGVLQPVGDSRPVDVNALENAIKRLVGETRWKEVAETGQTDFVCTLDTRGRFRANAFRERRGLAAVFRVIPPAPPTIDTLGLPAAVADLTNFRTGMVLCTGPAGCGKSTTLAALLDVVMRTRREHILTLENPIEFVYQGGLARVNQRHVGTHTTSFSRALRAALREDPDVIAVTELKDRETIALAMTASETGHLVLGSLHTLNAVQTIGRLISAFPAEEQPQIRVMMSEALRAVVSQRLIPRRDGKGRVVAVEILIVTPAVANLIRENKAFQIPSVMQVSKNLGMQLLDDSLAELVEKKLITEEDVKRNSTNAGNFE